MYKNILIPTDGSELAKKAVSKSCDLIVMSSHGRGGMGRMLLGSVATKVPTYSTMER